MRFPCGPGWLTGRVRRSRLQRSLRATFLGLIVNTLLAGGKIVAGAAGHSHALVADGVESPTAGHGLSDALIRGHQTPVCTTGLSEHRGGQTQ